MMLKDLKIEKLNWSGTESGEYPFEIHLNQKKYQVRVNDFPAESFYSLLEEGTAIDDWPKNWEKPSNLSMDH